MRLWWVVALAAVLAVGCAHGAPSAPSPDIYVMRHLQKADGGADPQLSEEGRANAERLVTAFAADPPRAIYVSRYLRARETAGPLAAKLKVTPKVYDPGEPEALVAAVMAETGTVLIIGHSNTVPDIVERLGGARPEALEESDYGDIFRISGPERRTERSKLGG